MDEGQRPPLRLVTAHAGRLHAGDDAAVAHTRPIGRRGVELIHARRADLAQEMLKKFVRKARGGRMQGLY